MRAKTILIADDETHILNVLSIKLQNAGFNVVTAEDGADAYNQARSVRPDLIITDYQMPMLSGLELCSKLQCDPLTRDVPAIILTARGFSISQADRKSRNIREVIAKPFSPREILSRVNDLLNASAAAGGAGP
jgi:CheY-like chemotaxis protein